jgi:hypothetical protein
MLTPDVAKQYTFAELLEVIAYQSALNTRDMLSDFIQDPDYLASEGIPTAECVRDHARDFACYTTPALTMDAGEFKDPLNQPNDPAVPDIVNALRVAVNRIYARYPELYKLQIDTRNVAKS